MVSQYIIALNEDSVNFLTVKRNKQIPVSILFAAYEKLIQKNDYVNALQILENFKHSSNHTKHIFLFNIAKIFTFLKN